MEPEAGAQLGSDAELITRVRVGDTAAFGELYRRHAAAATALARQVARSPAEADDLVSESFARVLDGLKAGGGPDTAFRAYLFTTLRHTAYDRTRKDSRLKFTDDMEAHETPVDAPDPVIAMAENGMVGKAFASLPERWQAVLWHTQVEGMSPAETGVLLGMSANAVTSLAFRAREGLREAYLQAHLAETAQEQCRWTTDRLGAWARGGLSKREQTTVDAHLESCEHCAALAAELTEINSSLRVLLAPLLLGGLAAGYLATLGPVGTLTQAGVLVGAGSAAGAAGTAGVAGTASAGTTAGAAAGAAGGAHAAGGASWFSRPWAAVGTGVAAASVAAVVAVIVATAGGSSPTNSADVGAQTAAVATGVGGGTGAGGTGAGGTGTGGPGGPGGTAGTDANGTDGPGSGSDDTGANGPGGTGVNGTDSNGTEGTNGNPPTDDATSNQTDSTDQPGATDQPNSADQTGNGDGVPGDPTTPPGQGGPPTSEPNVIPPPLVPTTPTGGPGTTQQTSAPTTPPSSPTSAGPTTTQAPTTPIAPTTPTAPTTPSAPATPTTPTRPTAPTSPTAPTTPTAPTSPTPPTTPTTPTTPAPPILAISADASASGAAGGSASVAASVSNTGGTASDDGSLVVTTPPGVSVSGYSTGQALRARPAVALAPIGLAAGCTDAGSSTTCGLPAVPAGQTMAISLTLAISPTAAPGVLTLQIGDISAEVKIGVEPGITGITVVDAPESLAVGQPTPITLAPILAEGVTESGPITMPVKSGGIWVTDYPDTCTESAGLLTCQPVVGENGAITYGPITVTVMPGATTDDSLSVTVPNGDETGITIVGGDTGITIEPWDPSSGSVDWTGPFDGETVGSETMRCSVAKVERALCQFPGVAFMEDIQPVKETEYQRKLSVPDGATVEAARLTWVASAPAKAGSLDSATLIVRRGGNVVVSVIKGSTGACADNAGPCPTIRYADVSALVQGADTIWLEPLAASKTTQRNGLTPMAAWSLNLVWLQPDSTASTRVQIAADIEFSWSGVLKNDTVELASMGDADLTELSGAVWAADPWADKNVVVGGRSLAPPPTLSGVDQHSHRTGFDLLDLHSKDLAGSAGGVVFTNAGDRLVRDQLWIGPLVIVRSVPDSQPPAA